MSGILTKICTKCKEELPATDKYFHKQKRGKYGVDSVCKECESKFMKQYRVNNSVMINQKRKDEAVVCKRLVISHYGGKCAVCGETHLAFLCIDHIHGGGRKHKDIIGVAGSKFYKWLIKNGFPSGFQVLCHNHNLKKHLEFQRSNNRNTPSAIGCKRHRDKLKHEVFSHYGMVCECCGEDDIDVLSMDHVEGGGTQHIEEIGGCNFYRVLKKRGYPPGFRVLGMNCNLGRSVNGGTCPHPRILNVSNEKKKTESGVVFMHVL